MMSFGGFEARRRGSGYPVDPISGSNQWIYNNFTNHQWIQSVDLTTTLQTISGSNQWILQTISGSNQWIYNHQWTRGWIA